LLSYQHGFHAGNHADVIKHLSWIAVIHGLKRKNKPFTLYDTHGGAGCYSLTSAQAQKTNESHTGIKLLDPTKVNAELLRDYLELVMPYYAVEQYPGSPLIAANLLRQQDQLHAMELHPGEYKLLNYTLHGQDISEGQLHCHHRNGLEGVVALAPPSPNRGAILIDPPYEQLREYQDIVDCCQAVLKRWHQAQIVIWYPLLSARAEDKQGASEAMVEQLSQLGYPCLNLQLTVMDEEDDPGMYGSGICIINPAWQLDTKIAEALNEVAPQLATQATTSMEWLVPAP
jgi:23S rRNA (adenine2030-N6)-methyltransferase